jgi:hypothetical protein
MLAFLAIRGIDGKQFPPASSAWSAIASKTSLSLDGKLSSKTAAITRMLMLAPPSYGAGTYSPVESGEQRCGVRLKKNSIRSPFFGKRWHRTCHHSPSTARRDREFIFARKNSATTKLNHSAINS